VNSKERKQAIKRGCIYLLASIPCAFLFMEIIELKYTILFWSFYAIMAISALIVEWNDYVPYDKKTTFQKRTEDVALISFLTLMSWYLGMLLVEWN